MALHPIEGRPGFFIDPEDPLRIVDVREFRESERMRPPSIEDETMTDTQGVQPPGSVRREWLFYKNDMVIERRAWTRRDWEETDLMYDPAEVWIDPANVPSLFTPVEGSPGVFKNSVGDIVCPHSMSIRRS